MGSPKTSKGMALKGIAIPSTLKNYGCFLFAVVMYISHQTGSPFVKATLSPVAPYWTFNNHVQRLHHNLYNVPSFESPLN